MQINRMLVASFLTLSGTSQLVGAMRFSHNAKEILQSRARRCACYNSIRRRMVGATGISPVETDDSLHFGDSDGEASPESEARSSANWNPGATTVETGSSRETSQIEGSYKHVESEGSQHNMEESSKHESESSNQIEGSFMNDKNPEHPEGVNTDDQEANALDKYTKLFLSGGTLFTGAGLGIVAYHIGNHKSTDWTMDACSLTLIYVFLVLGLGMLFFSVTQRMGGEMKAIMLFSGLAVGGFFAGGVHMVFDQDVALWGSIVCFAIAGSALVLISIGIGVMHGRNELDREYDAEARKMMPMIVLRGIVNTIGSVTFLVGCGITAQDLGTYHDSLSNPALNIGSLITLIIGFIWFSHTFFCKIWTKGKPRMTALGIVCALASAGIGVLVVAGANQMAYGETGIATILFGVAGSLFAVMIVAKLIVTLVSCKRAKDKALDLKM